VALEGGKEEEGQSGSEAERRGGRRARQEGGLGRPKMEVARS
jgi:hypothetical protein